MKKASENREQENKEFQETIADQRATQAIFKKAGGGGAMALIENIIADSVKVEKDAIAAEQDAQIAYEGFIKDNNAAIKAKQEAIVTDERAEAQDRIDETNDETDKRGTIS